MHFLEIKSKVKNHHIPEAGVSFENTVWSVYQDMGWRTHVYIWQQTIALKFSSKLIFHKVHS